MITPGPQTARTEARVFEHEVHFNHEQQAIETDESGETEIEITGRETGRTEKRGKDPADGPGLASVLRHEPSELSGDPR